MKVARDTPTAGEAKRAFVCVADLHSAVVEESESDTGEGIVQAYVIDGVLVVTAHGSQADRITALLKASEIATPLSITERALWRIRATSDEAA